MGPTKKTGCFKRTGMVHSVELTSSGRSAVVKSDDMYFQLPWLAHLACGDYKYEAGDYVSAVLDVGQTTQPIRAQKAMLLNGRVICLDAGALVVSVGGMISSFKGDFPGVCVGDRASIALEKLRKRLRQK